MNQTTLAAQYKAAFQFLIEKPSSKLNEHILQLQKMEQYLPKGLTFMFITNAATQEYQYFTNNVENCTGFTKEELYQGGVPFVMNRVHPQDKEFWNKAVNLLTNQLFLLSPTKMLQCNLQFNYRFQHKNGKYLNVIDNFIPIEINQEGKPFIFFGQVNIVGSGEKLPINASMSILTKNGYKNLYAVNVEKVTQAALLSPREKEIYNLIQKGYTSTAIAKTCVISLDTVKTHRKNINTKLKQLTFSKEEVLLSKL